MNVKKQLAKLSQKQFLVVTNGDYGDECQLYDFDALLTEFWLEPKIVDGLLGFWQTDCNDWLIVPQKTADWHELMEDLLSEISKCALDVTAIACVKDERFCFASVLN